MSKILVLDYSRTGNTAKMVKAVVQGVKTVLGVEVEINRGVTPEKLGVFDAILIGTPTYHHDMPNDVKELFEKAAIRKVILKGKIGAAFGSYGWSGEAPGLAIEIMKNKFEMEVAEPPILAKYQPDQSTLEKCQALGKRTAEKLTSWESY